jgi:hypothetical protein
MWQTFGLEKYKKTSQMVNNDLLHTLLFVIYFMGERLKSCDFLLQNLTKEFDVKEVPGRGFHI